MPSKPIHLRATDLNVHRGLVGSPSGPPCATHDGQSGESLNRLPGTPATILSGGARQWPASLLGKLGST